MYIGVSATSLHLVNVMICPIKRIRGTYLAIDIPEVWRLVVASRSPQFSLELPTSIFSKRSLITIFPRLSIRRPTTGRSVGPSVTMCNCHSWDHLLMVAEHRDLLLLCCRFVSAVEVAASVSDCDGNVNKCDKDTPLFWQNMLTLIDAVGLNPNQWKFVFSC